MRRFPDHQPAERDPLGPKPNLIAAVSSDASFREERHGEEAVTRPTHRPIGCPYLSAIDPICLDILYNRGIKTAVFVKKEPI